MNSKFSDRTNGIAAKLSQQRRKAANAVSPEASAYSVTFEKKHYEKAQQWKKETKSHLGFTFTQGGVIALFAEESDAKFFNKQILTLEAIELDIQPIMSEQDLVLFTQALGVRMLNHKDGQNVQRVYMDAVPKCLLFAPEPILKTDHGKVITFQWVLRENCTRCNAPGHRQVKCPLNQTEIAAYQAQIDIGRLKPKEYNQRVPKKKLPQVPKQTSKETLTVHLRQANPKTSKWQQKGQKTEEEPLKNKKLTNDFLNSLSTSTQPVKPTYLDAATGAQQMTSEADLEKTQQQVINEQHSELSQQSPDNTTQPMEQEGGDLKQENTRPIPNSHLALNTKPLKMIKPPNRVKIQTRIGKNNCYQADMVDGIISSGRHVYYHIKFTNFQSHEDDGYAYPKSHFDLDTLCELLHNGIENGLEKNLIKDEIVIKRMKERYPSSNY